MADNILLYLLETAVKLFTDGNLVNLAKDLIRAQFNNDLEGEEKHANVMVELKEFGAEFTDTILDIIIKVGLLVVKAEIADMTDGN